jgi:hypothetical protein
MIHKKSALLVRPANELHRKTGSYFEELVTYIRFTRKNALTCMRNVVNETILQHVVIKKRKEVFV